MDVIYPTTGGFPSEKILPLIPELFTRIAPEKQVQLQEVLADITLTITDNAEWDCKASKGWKLIIISRKTIEVTWALSYAYWSFYQNFSTNYTPDGQKRNLATDQSLVAPRQLLLWAVDNLTHKAVRELPAGLPNIKDAFQEGSDLHAVLEIALAAIAFFLHHELAHIKFADQHFATILDEERACDKEAASVILAVDNKAQLTVRALGAATGLLLINAIGLHNGFFDGIEHPFAYDRLMSLDEWIDKDSDSVWGWIVSMLALHMTNAGIEQPTQEFDNFYDCAQVYRLMLSTHQSK